MEKWARNVRGSVIVKWETNKEKNSSKEGESVGNRLMIQLLMWLNRSVAKINATLQFLDILITGPYDAWEYIIIFNCGICIICSLKFVENNLFSLKIKQFLKLFIHLSISTNISLYYFGCVWLILSYSSWSIFFKILL